MRSKPFLADVLKEDIDRVEEHGPRVLKSNHNVLQDFQEGHILLEWVDEMTPWERYVCTRHIHSDALLHRTQLLWGIRSLEKESCHL